ncbi:5-(carboxyamino)imidazole ribonucleotide synthase [Mycetocola tolaasinivorans]|uniref:N5-carboxyaminoimidazole ribonucleotide synthase n=1 Tax=Mycetocola tolaasinivorans TaxID=76635 RepID=A0A3L7A7Y3_9MICO|nr:5-(carboxyamino)imidazole ribonucleotide synthase [Mycetocola tolaasinivorans]RLP75978.1 5-(carboxyamino)imidazole ribonucleotide synthase [Mycetocola tolaasinivorans]
MCTGRIVYPVFYNISFESAEEHASETETHVLKIGVIGGGQLARMMIPAAINLALDVRVLAEAPGSPAEIAATSVGDYRDAATVLAFAAEVDVITFDHEHVPQSVLAALVATGVRVHPGPDALLYAQDKLLMRAKLSELGLPTPDWAEVRSAAELQTFLDAHGGAGVLKTPRGGYDGKGVRVVRSAAEATDWFTAVAESGDTGSLLVEELVDFTRELALLGARRPGGQSAYWPVVETIQRDGVCAEVLAPAPTSDTAVAAEAERIARALADGLGITGVFAVELFETRDGRVLVNEMAMRPHNSGHWTQDGSFTSQFEQHLRAIADLPLGDPAPRAPITVMANILGGPVEGTLADRYPLVMAQFPEAKIHNYNKEPRPGRKVGHVNVTGTDLGEVRTRAREIESLFQG